MRSFPYWQDYPLSLVNANTVKEFRVHGSWISCFLASEEFDISVEGSPLLKFNQGLRMGFDEQQVLVRVTAKAGAVTFPNTIILRVGVGEYVDARFSVAAPLQIAAGAVIQPKSAATLTGGDLAALVAATNTDILAANAARRCARIRNNSLTADVRVSTDAASLTAGGGELIRPGEVIEVFVTGLLKARSAGTPVLTVAEETF